MIEPPAQPSRLDPHDGIGLRIEVVATFEDLGADGVALDALGLALEGGFDDELEELLQAFAGREVLAGHDSANLVPHLGGRWVHWLIIRSVHRQRTILVTES